MGITIAGPAAASSPSTSLPPLVWLRETWLDEWTWQPDLRPVDCQISSASDGPGSCTLRREYGTTKLPWEAAFSIKTPLSDLAGWWVLVTAAGQNGYEPIFVGQIVSETRELFGSDLAASGAQTWHATGPVAVLDRIHLSRSYWWGETSPCKWVPPMNDRDGRGLLVGNRSNVTYEGYYRFGGTDTWTHYQFLLYLLNYFVNTDDEAPVWTVGGQIECLQALTGAIRFSATQTIAEVLGALIPRERGLDYLIEATDDGFRIRVFSLNPWSWIFGSVTLPSNPDRVELTVGDSVDQIRTATAHTVERQAGTIRVLGKRAVMCCTLAGESATNNVTTLAPHPNAGSLAPLWAWGQTEYLAGAGTGETADRNDRERNRDCYSAVFQSYGMTSAFDLDEADWFPTLLPGGSVDWATRSPRNLFAGMLLDWTPLAGNVDYSDGGDDILDATLGTVDFLPPAVWVTKWTQWHEVQTDDQGYTLAEKVGIGVKVSQIAPWQIDLSCPYNHVLAANHWSGANDTKHVPLYDYDYLVATVAFELDERFYVETKLPGATVADGVIEIEVDDAELWLLAPNTVVGVDENLSYVTSGTSGRIIRRDLEKLEQAGAAAMARHYCPRSRAVVATAGLLPWGGLVGRILDLVSSGGETRVIGAAITSIHWTIPDRDGGLPVTTVSTGYAG